MESVAEPPQPVFPTRPATVPDPAGNFSEYFSDMDCIPEGEIWEPKVLEGAKGLFSWGPPPPPSFLEPEDLAALMTGAHSKGSIRGAEASVRRHGQGTVRQTQVPAAGNNSPRPMCPAVPRGFWSHSSRWHHCCWVYRLTRLS